MAPEILPLIIKTLLSPNLILDKNFDFYFIELTRRCPGDLYSLLIKKSTNYEYVKNYVNCLIGLNFEEAEIINRFVLRRSIFKKNELKCSNFNEVFRSFNSFNAKDKNQRIAIEFEEFEDIESIEKRI